MKFKINDVIRPKDPNLKHVKCRVIRADSFTYRVAWTRYALGLPRHRGPTREQQVDNETSLHALTVDERWELALNGVEWMLRLLHEV